MLVTPGRSERVKGTSTGCDPGSDFRGKLLKLTENKNHYKNMYI